MSKIVSIKLYSNEYYLVGDANTGITKIEKIYDEDGRLWFGVSDYRGDYIEVNPHYVVTVRWSKEQ
jgi:hypothetical protein